MSASPRSGATSRLAQAMLLALAARAAASTMLFYAKLRLRLALWRLKAGRRFKASLEGLPPELAEELAREYRREAGEAAAAILEAAKAATRLAVRSAG